MKIKSLPLLLNSKGIYYGWVVVVFGTIGVVMSVPGQTMGVSVYTEHLIKALGINRTQLSLAYMFGTLSSAFLLPFAGKLLDRIGARIMGGFAAFGLGSFLILLSFSPRISELVGYPFIVAFLCFVGIRHFGQGQLTMCSRTMMGLWFEKRRGMVLGISGAIVSFCFGSAPVFLTSLIGEHGWRESLHILAIICFTMAILAWSFFRRSPEHSGLQLDGGELQTAKSDDELVPDPNSFTSTEARKTFTFWIYNLAMAANATLVTAMTFHLTDIGKIVGLDNVKSFSVFIPASIIAISTEIIGGFLSDRIPIKFLLALMQLCLGIGIVCLTQFQTDIGFYAVAAGLGISGGMFALLNGVAWPKLFGRTHLGSIMGIVTSCMVAGSALGPYAFSLGKKYSGNYHLIIILSTVIPAILFCCAFFANNPRKKQL